MLHVALTGGIATGKSTVRRGFAGLGVPTVDSDAVVHELLREGTAVSAAVARRFGPAVLASDGSVDRVALGRLVFGDFRARRALEEIVHPVVYERIAGWFAALDTVPCGWALADVPLLYETGRQGDFDRVIVTACEPAVQMTRVMMRDGLSRAGAEARLLAQWPIVEKARLADEVIRTDGTLEDTDRQVREVYERLRAASSRT